MIHFPADLITHWFTVDWLISPAYYWLLYLLTECLLLSHCLLETDWLTDSHTHLLFHWLIKTGWMTYLLTGQFAELQNNWLCGSLTNFWFNWWARQVQRFVLSHFKCQILMLFINPQLDTMNRITLKWSWKTII